MEQEYARARTNRAHRRAEVDVFVPLSCFVAVFFVCFLVSFSLVFFRTCLLVVSLASPASVLLFTCALCFLVALSLSMLPPLLSLFFLSVCFCGKFGPACVCNLLLFVGLGVRGAKLLMLVCLLLCFRFPFVSCLLECGPSVCTQLL